jgi:hypothetical protein
LTLVIGPAGTHEKAALEGRPSSAIWLAGRGDIIER